MIVGGKGLKDGIVEIKRRTDSDAARVPLAEAASYVQDLIGKP
jgi:hypothetical protein